MIDTDNTVNDTDRLYEELNLQQKMEGVRQSGKDDFAMKKQRRADAKQGKKDSIVWRDED